MGEFGVGVVPEGDAEVGELCPHVLSRIAAGGLDRGGATRALWTSPTLGTIGEINDRVCGRGGNQKEQCECGNDSCRVRGQLHFNESPWIKGASLWDTFQWHLGHAFVRIMTHGKG